MPVGWGGVGCMQDMVPEQLIAAKGMLRLCFFPRRESLPFFTYTSLLDSHRHQTGAITIALMH